MTLFYPEIAKLGEEKVVVTPEPELDPNGDPIEGTAEPFDVNRCALWPAGSSEDNFRASTVSDKYVMVAPVYETDLSSTMTVTWRGVTYRIEGRPMPWVHGDGVYGGTQVNLTRGS